MSANPITANDVVKYLRDVLNMDISNALVMEDIVEDLKSIHDLAEFRIYIKENFTESQYQYLTGYQKFLALTKDFKRENKPKLTADQRLNADKYSEKLFSKVTDVFDEINWMIQVGKDIYSKEANLIVFNAFGNEPKDLQVLEQIGKRAELCRLCSSNKEVLRTKINEAVCKLTLLKHYPQLAYKNKDQQVMAKLAAGSSK